MGKSCTYKGVIRVNGRAMYASPLRIWSAKTTESGDGKYILDNWALKLALSI